MEYRVGVFTGVHLALGLSMLHFEGMLLGIPSDLTALVLAIFAALVLALASLATRPAADPGAPVDADLQWGLVGWLTWLATALQLSMPFLLRYMGASSRQERAGELPLVGGTLAALATLWSAGLVPAAAARPSDRQGLLVGAMLGSIPLLVAVPGGPRVIPLVFAVMGLILSQSVFPMRRPWLVVMVPLVGLAHVHIPDLLHRHSAGWLLQHVHAVAGGRLDRLELSPGGPRADLTSFRGASRQVLGPAELPGGGWPTDRAACLAVIPAQLATKGDVLVVRRQLTHGLPLPPPTNRRVVIWTWDGAAPVAEGQTPVTGPYPPDGPFSLVILDLPRSTDLTGSALVCKQTIARLSERLSPEGFIVALQDSSLISPRRSSFRLAAALTQQFRTCLAYSRNVGNHTYLIAGDKLPFRPARLADLLARMSGPDWVIHDDAALRQRVGRVEPLNLLNPERAWLDQLDDRILPHERTIAARQADPRTRLDPSVRDTR